jgi:RNA polymerase sigma-70 factor (ECF subfamily)
VSSDPWTTEGATPPAGEELARSLELVRLARAGDARAVDELFERYRPRLARIVRIRMGARLRNRLDEEDVLQEVFLTAARKLPEFEARSHAAILGWLVALAEHQIANVARGLAAGKRMPGSGSSAGGRVPLEELSAGDTSPSQLSMRAELEELVDAAVRELDPPLYREVILLRDYHLAEWEEVRQSLDRETVAAAQELYRRAHRRLRERLEKYREPG